MWSLGVEAGMHCKKKAHLASKQQRVRQSDTQKKVGDMHSIFLCPSGCIGISSLQRGAHQLCLLVSKPHKYYIIGSYRSIIVFGVMFHQLSYHLGPKLPPQHLRRHVRGTHPPEHAWSDAQRRLLTGQTCGCMWKVGFTPNICSIIIFLLEYLRGGLYIILRGSLWPVVPSSCHWGAGCTVDAASRPGRTIIPEIVFKSQPATNGRTLGFNHYINVLENWDLTIKTTGT